MERTVLRGSVALLLALCGALAFSAEPESPRDRLEAFNERIAAELKARNPDAAQMFSRADDARDDGQLETAVFLYARVREMEPGFAHASRRLCLSLLALERRDEAVEICRDAVALEESPENLSALALSLARSTRTVAATPGQLDEAERLAERASTDQPDDFFSQTVLCEVAMIRFNLDHLRICTNPLARIAPDEVVTAYLGTILAIGEERQVEALEYLARARDLGMPEETYDYLSSAIGRVNAEKAGLKKRGRGPSAAQVGAVVVLHFAVIALVWGGLRRRALRRESS
jgi:tetratricopeptide (TPR) repeat protein